MWPQVELWQIDWESSRALALTAAIGRRWGRCLGLNLDDLPCRNLRPINSHFEPLSKKGLPEFQAERPVGRASSRKRRQFVDAGRQPLPQAATADFCRAGASPGPAV